MPSITFDPSTRLDSRPRARPVTLLPDPAQRRRWHTIISVDDHVVEAPDVFTSRMPATLRDRAPRIIQLDDGTQMWEFDGQRLPNVGLSAVVGRPPQEYDNEPQRFEDMRPGCYQPAERVRDMNLNGVTASLNFPSMIPGFAGTKFAKARDPQVGLAAVRAWNDWIDEEWAGPFPDRFIPCQIPYLPDIEVAAKEIRANAARGFKAVSFVELPENVGLPSLHTGAWDPFVQACVDTGTVICLHVGSSATTHVSSSDAPNESLSALFMVNAQVAAVDWLYSKIPLRFPDVRLVMSEGGIGWVPALIDRIDRTFRHLPYLTEWSRFGAEHSTLPGDVLRRNFWFCAIDEPHGMAMCDVIGVENVMVECDYPHADSSWPDTQEVVRQQVADLDAAAAERITWRNAAELFRHPVSADQGADIATGAGDV